MIGRKYLIAILYSSVCSREELTRNGCSMLPTTRNLANRRLQEWPLNLFR